MKNTYPLRSINVAKIVTKTYGDKVFSTAVNKMPVLDEVLITRIGIQGDEQTPEYHGGEEKALCLYADDHRDFWLNYGVSFLQEGALFGENLSSIGLIEDEACIGDVYSLGQAVIQIAQPRIPCYKIAAKYGLSDLASVMAKEGNTGFLFRVLKEGVASVQDPLILQERHPLRVSVSQVNRVMYHDDQASIERVLSVDALSESFRREVEKRKEAKKN